MKFSKAFTLLLTTVAAVILAASASRAFAGEAKMADPRKLLWQIGKPDNDDREFALWLASEVGVATVPGSSFHATPGMGRRYVRFAFCKKTATIEAAAERLDVVRGRRPAIQRRGSPFSSRS